MPPMTGQPLHEIKARSEIWPQFDDAVGPLHRLVAGHTSGARLYPCLSHYHVK
jgi:hypothetical protein